MTPTEHALDLPRYRDWSPTSFDSKGLALRDQQDWIVLPITQTRDSDCLERSNFHSAEEALLEVDPDGFENHRFGHWGPGWIEILIVNPESPKALKEAGEIVCAMADYPVLNESHWIGLEDEEKGEQWETWGRSEFRDFVALQLDLSFEAKDLLDEADDDQIFQMANRLEYEWSERGGFHWNQPDRSEVAALLWATRKRLRI